MMVVIVPMVVMAVVVMPMVIVVVMVMASAMTRVVAIVAMVLVAGRRVGHSLILHAPGFCSKH
jgi:hypothetical protein